MDTEIKYGSYIGITWFAGLFVTALVCLLKGTDAGWISFIPLVLVPAFVIAGLKDYTGVSKANAFRSGMLITVAGAAFMPFITIVYYRIVHSGWGVPNYFTLPNLIVVSGSSIVLTGMATTLLYLSFASKRQ